MAQKGNDPCLDRVKPGEPIITLRAQDQLMVPTLMFYEQELKKHGAPAEKRQGILDLIDEVVSWQSQNPIKIPD